MSIASTAKAALLRNYSGSTDNKGYTKSPQENLLAGIDLSLFTLEEAGILIRTLEEIQNA